MAQVTSLRDAPDFVPMIRRLRSQPHRHFLHPSRTVATPPFSSSARHAVHSQVLAVTRWRGHPYAEGTAGRPVACLRRREARPAEHVLFLVITDGQENSSRETSLDQVRRLIHEREAQGQWTFAYLGADTERGIAQSGMARGSVAAFQAADPRRSFRLASESAIVGSGNSGPDFRNSGYVRPTPRRHITVRNLTPTSLVVIELVVDRRRSTPPADCGLLP